MATKPSSPRPAAESSAEVDAPAVAAASASAPRALSSPSFKAIRSARAFEEIADQIRKELSEGNLRTGSRLPSERALAEQFGVSRNTLREALRSLEHAGLIRLQKGATGGAFISERSNEAIVTGMMDMYHVGAITPEKLTEARIWLESMIVREACSRATSEDIEALKANIRIAEEADARGDFAVRASTHIDFHRILARITDNPIIVTVMEGVLNVLGSFIQSIGNYENAFVLPSRRRFVKHLIAGDAEAAVAEMETSLKRLQRNYLSRVEMKRNGETAGTTEPAKAKRH
ncbi:MAG: GntR family transcriptional regulator [Rhizobacter sp.]|nr:GntR family transcriptional regulator [Rhizobacter sp.]